MGNGIGCGADDVPRLGESIPLAGGFHGADGFQCRLRHGVEVVDHDALPRAGPDAGHSPPFFNLGQEEGVRNAQQVVFIQAAGGFDNAALQQVQVALDGVAGEPRLGERIGGDGVAVGVLGTRYSGAVALVDNVGAA